MSVLLRKLTKKSTLNFGKFKDYTVEHLFGMKKQIELTSIYFKLSTITFTDDILDELGITEEWRIIKPSKNVELYQDFMSMKYGRKQKPNKQLQSMRKETTSYRKDFLTHLNHGHHR
jgi:hypothetical protein